MELVRAVALNADGSRMATLTSREARLWDMGTGKLLDTMVPPAGEAGRLMSMEMSPDGHTIAVGGSGPLFGGFGSVPSHIWLWDLATGKKRKRIDHDDAAAAVSLAYSPDGRLLADGGQTGSIRVWDLAADRARQTLLHGGGPIWAVVFSPDGKQIFTGGADHEICRWDTATGRHLGSLSGHEHLVLALAVSPDGRTLASGSYDQTLKIWDTASGKVRATLPMGGWVHALAYSPDGRSLAVGIRAKAAALRLLTVADGL